eukprot:866513_1
MTMVLGSLIVMFLLEIPCTSVSIREPTPKRQKQNSMLNITFTDYDLETVAWYSNITDETHLFNKMYQLTRDMMHPITLAPQSNIPVQIVRAVLNAMLTWYGHRTDLTFKLNPRKIQRLLHVINQAMHPILCYLNTFIELEVLITAFASTDHRFNHLLQCLYYELYTQWISNHALQFVSKIGAGHQANVIKVQDAKNNHTYALKLYTSAKDCVEEFHIFERIENEIHAANISINTPRLISGYDITCSKHYALLMQYIDGIEIHQIIKMFTKDTAQKMWIQLSDTINKLGNRGIGHFDLNACNILVDNDDTFWLIDFGFGISISANAGTRDLRLVPNPIIGTWCFYSPQAYELSLIIRQLSRSRAISQQLTNVGRVRVNQLIIDANLYSLQALMFFMSAYNPYTNERIMALHGQIDALWTKNGDHDDVTPEMMMHLTKIWTIRSIIVEKYLRLCQGKPHVLEQSNLNRLVVDVSSINKLVNAHFGLRSFLT